MRDPLTTVELIKTGLDLREKDQALDGVVNRRVRRKLAEGFDHPVTGNLNGHLV